MKRVIYTFFIVFFLFFLPPIPTCYNMKLVEEMVKEVRSVAMIISKFWCIATLVGL